MSKIKQCKQCGYLKPLDQYRKYYGGRKGTYTTCKTCEKINSRAKYLTNKGDKCGEAEIAELNKIHELWKVQRMAGLQPPRENTGRTVPITESLDDMIGKYKQQAEVVQAVGDIGVPAELSRWLTETLTEEPEYYQDEVYDSLRATYRPKTKIDPDTMLPMYDDTYLPVLDKILERFNEYEDEYYDKDGE